MKIKFKKLYLKNFMSFEESEITLNDLGYTLIHGINENPDDMAKSNGTGKSAQADAINWCLTGETIRGTKEVVRFNSSGGCEVRLECTINGQEFEIIRTKDPSNLKIVVDGVDKSGKGIRDTQKLLEEYLPDLTPELIGSVIILGQGLPQRFSNNTPSGRKDVLEKLSKSDFMIQDIKERLTTRKSSLLNNLRELEDLKLKLSTEEELLIKNINDNQIKVDTLSSETLENNIKSIEEKLKVDKLSLEEKKKDLEKLNSEESKYSLEIQSITNKYNIDKDELSKKSSLEIDPLKESQIKYDSEISSLTSRINELKAIKDICPTCGQKLPDVKVVDTTEFEAELSRLKDERETISSKLVNVKTNLETALNSLKSDFEMNTSELNKKVAEIRVSVSSLVAEVSSLERKINEFEVDLARNKSDLDNFNLNKSSLISTIETDKLSLSKIKEKILYTNSDLEEVNGKVELNSRMLNLITRDFRGYLLVNVISFINSKSKEYSMELFETDKVEFVLDGNNIDIYYDGKPYECLSGGERQKIDIIVQLSLRDMLCTHLDFSSNILILDEISDNLDSLGAEKLFNLISNKLKDVESIFIISHHSDYSLPVDNIITIIKDSNKISRII